MYVNSNPLAHPDLGGAQAVKLLIAGGFGVGKTTLVSAVSEINPLRTEERLSEIGAPVDNLTGVAAKTTTTVALDFGRITINPEVVLYLFGTPGQDRFWFMWKELSAGALGAVVLADTRRLGDCFGAVDFFESRGIPFIVAVNCFDDADIYHEDEVRHALDIGFHVPIQFCDARDRGSGKQVLVRLMEYLVATATARLGIRLPLAGAPAMQAGHASCINAIPGRRSQESSAPSRYSSPRTGGSTGRGCIAPHGINAYIVRWARNKYRRLVSFKKANRWWAGLVDREPGLFAHCAWVSTF